MRSPQLRSSSRDDGYATAEFAVLLPAVVAVVVLAVWLVAAAATAVGLEMRAGQVARMAARGQSYAQLVPEPITAQVQQVGEFVQVELRREFPIGVGRFALGVAPLHAEALAAVEENW